MLSFHLKNCYVYFFNKMKRNRTEPLIKTKTPKPSPRSSINLSSSLTKSMRTLSELSPMQIFTKEFHSLEMMITKLRQLHIPQGVEVIFENFSSLKSRYSTFCSNCNTLTKRIALKNAEIEIAPEIKENCRQFMLDFGELLVSFETIDNSMQNLYTYHLTRLSKSMAANITKYANICYQDHRTRSIYQQFESFMKSNLDQAQIDLYEFLQNSNFDDVTPEKSSHIIERYKQISRKIEIEIPHAINLQRLVVPNGDSIIKLFHADFVDFVPLLNSIHNFVHEITEIFEKIPNFSTALHNLIESVGLPINPQQTTPLPSPRATSRSISSMQEFPPHPQDPFDIYVPQICFSLGLAEPGKEQNKEEILMEILHAAQEIKDLHNLEIHKLNTRIEALQDINPSSSLSERNKENREYKEELQKKFQLEIEKIYRDTLNQIQSLSPAVITSRTDSTKTKIDCIVTSVQEMLDKQKESLKRANDEIDQSKEVLKQLRDKLLGKETDFTEYLPNIIDNTIQAMENTRRALDQELKDINPSNNSLDEFLNQVLTQFCNYKPQELKNLTNDRMRYMVGRYILDQKEEIRKLKEDLQKEKDMKNDLNDNIVGVLSQFKCKLEEQLDDVEDTENTYPKLKERIQNLLNLHDTKEKDRKSFKSFLSSFLSQVLHALRLPQIRFRDATEQQLKNVMISILDSSEIQRNLSLSSSSQSTTSSTRKNSIVVRERSKTTRELPQTPKASSNFSLVPSVPTSVRRGTVMIRSDQTTSTPNMGQKSPSSANNSIRRRMSTTTTDVDDKNYNEIKQKIAEICSVVEGSPAVTYMYIPIDILIKQLKQSVISKIDSLTNLRSLAADVCVLISSPDKILKNEVLKKPNEEIFEFILKGIELIKATKTDLQQETIKEMCRNVSNDDVDFMTVPDLISFAKSQLKLSKNTSQLTQKMAATLKEIMEQITSNKSFSPSNERYSRYTEKIDLMMKEFSVVPADSILPSVLNYLSQATTLINTITKCLTASSFAPEYESNFEAMQRIVDERQTLSLKCDTLEKEVEKSNKEKEVARKKLYDIMTAAKMAANHRINLMKRANTEDMTHAINYFRNMDSSSEDE